VVRCTHYRLDPYTRKEGWKGSRRQRVVLKIKVSRYNETQSQDKKNLLNQITVFWVLTW
jgi:hypothetical protein